MIKPHVCTSRKDTGINSGRFVLNLLFLWLAAKPSRRRVHAAEKGNFGHVARKDTAERPPQPSAKPASILDGVPKSVILAHVVSVD